MPPLMPQHFMVIRTRGPGWKDSRPLESQDDWAGHASFMNALAKEGFVIGEEPIPLPTAADVLLIVKATSPDEIRSRLAEDPWTIRDLLRVIRISPWTLRLGSLG